MNAICWSRNLAGDFAEIVNKFHLQENMTEVSIDDLMNSSCQKAVIWQERLS